MLVKMLLQYPGPKSLLNRSPRSDRIVFSFITPLFIARHCHPLFVFSLVKPIRPTCGHSFVLQYTIVDGCSCPPMFLIKSTEDFIVLSWFNFLTFVFLGLCIIKLANGRLGDRLEPVQDKEIFLFTSPEIVRLIKPPFARKVFSSTPLNPIYRPMQLIRSRSSGYDDGRDGTMIQQGNTLKTCCHQCPQRDYQTRTCPGNRTVSSRRSTWAYIMVSVFLSNGGLELYTFFLHHREQACVSVD